MVSASRRLEESRRKRPVRKIPDWYGLRLKIRSMDADLADAANVVVFEEINRIRELSFCQFRFASSELITVQADEAPNGTGPQFVNTTHAGATVLSLPSGVPTRGNARSGRLAA
jgi:hypothetical protein